jgi:hypothetical protein
MNPIFSKASFEAAQVDRDELRSKLSSEIARRIHDVTQREFAAIGDELQALGHQTAVHSEYDPEFVAWHYSAKPIGRNEGELGLRFYYDCQVSSWYD